jgi:Ca-activated chloride channel homolog
MGFVMRVLGNLSVWARGLALATLAVAPFSPPRAVSGEGRAVIYVADRSASVGEDGSAKASRFLREAWEARGETSVGLVTVDGAPELTRRVGAEAPPMPLAPAAAGAGTDLASAVRLATAALPRSGERRIVLLTDGRATRGDAVAEVSRAREQGIVVDAVPIGATSFEAPTITAVTVREPRVAEGAPVTLVTHVRGDRSKGITVRLFRDGEPIERRVEGLDDDGAAELTFTDAHPGAGTHIYEARVDRPSDGGGDGARGVAAVVVGGKPRALVITLDGHCPAILADVLDKAELDKRVLTLGDAPVDAAALSGVDLVILADVPLAPGDPASGEPRALAGLPPRAQEALVEFAQRGGGVIVTGGAFGFAPEYASAPIARMLPVAIEDQGQVEDPRVAMAIMLDRSGSMAAPVGTHTKIELAVEASLAAASTLRPDDSLALGSVDERTHWNQPLGPVSGLEGRKQEIRGIDAGGGGIFVYTALADAYGALKGTTAAVRHVILFSDTADSEEQQSSCEGSCGDAPPTAVALAEAARKLGITTSVVGIGREEDSDTPFLKQLAAAAGGRFYLTSDGTDLRRIFVSETRVAARSNLREGPVEVAVASDHPSLAGVDTSRLPPLGGFVEARRRATADTALVTREGDRPILASWRYGLGKVTALTTDLRGDWKGKWASFRGAGQVLRQTVRYSLRRSGEATADIRVAARERAVEVSLDVEANDDREATRAPSIEAFAIADDGKASPVEVVLTRAAPGRFTARGKLDGQPFVLVRARDAHGGLIGEAIGARDSASELSAIGPDVRALGELARAGEGLYDPDPAATLRGGGPRGREPVPTWPFLLLGAAALVCVDLWLRRLGPRRTAFALPAVPTPKLASSAASGAFALPSSAPNAPAGAAVPDPLPARAA